MVFPKMNKAYSPPVKMQCEVPKIAMASRLFPSTLHNNGRHININFNALVRQDGSSINVDLISNCHIVTEDTDVLQPRPFSYSRVPAYDCALNPCVILDLGAREQHTTLQADTVAYDDIRANGNVRANSAVLANFGGRIDEDIAAMDIGCVVGGEEFGSFLCEG